jgi:hypothetical protein
MFHRKPQLKLKYNTQPLFIEKTGNSDRILVDNILPFAFLISSVAGSLHLSGFSSHVKSVSKMGMIIGSPEFP